EEMDSAGVLRVNPVWYRLSEMPRDVLLLHRAAQWHYAVDAEGHIRIGSEELGGMLPDDELADLYADHHGGKAAESPELAAFRDLINGQGHPTIAVEFGDFGAVA